MALAAGSDQLSAPRPDPEPRHDAGRNARAYWHLATTAPARAFDVGRDQTFLWLGEPHHRVFEALYGAVLRGCPLVMLTGEVGVGKTMLVDAVASRVVDDGVMVGRLLYPAREPEDFWNAAAGAFGILPEAHGRDAALTRFTQLVRRVAARTSRRMLLIIDEAQVLTPEVLTEVGRACEVARDASVPNMLTVALVGGEELQSTLAAPELADLAGRVGMRCRLPALSELEVASYVRHRLACAETPTVFTDDGLRAIGAMSRGIPRLVNTLCARAIMAGDVVDSTIVERCGGEMAWLADSPGRCAPLDTRPFGSLLSRMPARTRGLVIAALASAAVVVMGVSRVADRPAASRHAGAAIPVVGLPPRAEPARAPAITAVPTPTLAVDDSLPSRLAPPPATPSASPRQRSTGKTLPREEMHRATDNTRTPTRPLPAPHNIKPRDDVRDDGPDAGAIIDWLLKEGSRTATIRR